jgi:hypothetical protein
MDLWYIKIAEKGEGVRHSVYQSINLMFIIFFRVASSKDTVRKDLFTNIWQPLV